MVILRFLYSWSMKLPATLTVNKGWMRVANLNMTDPNQQCPDNLELSYTNPKRLCGRRRTDRGCDSVIFPTYGVQYQQVYVGE